MCWLRVQGFVLKLVLQIIEPFFEKCSKCSKADVKPLIIYVITDGAPTTDRGLATSVPTFAMLKRIDDTLVRLGLPRKTVGVNVTQIGFDEGATQFLQQLDDHPLFGDRVDCVSDYEQAAALHPSQQNPKPSTTKPQTP